MKRKGIEQILINYFYEHKGSWVKKGDLYQLAFEHNYSPEYLGRALRQFVTDGVLKVGYYDGKYAKNLAQYIYGGIPTTKTIYQEVEVDGVRKMLVRQESVIM